MSISDRAPSVIALVLALALLAVADSAFGLFANRHFLPARKLQASLANGELDVLIAGDSRMVAALDLGHFEGGWRECSHRTPRVADLSLGGVEIAGQAIAVRRFFERGGSAKLVVLGTVPEALASEPADPDAWIGNEALVLWWSRASDARLHFRPSNPALNPKALDSHFRFLAYRTSSLASLRSLLWARAQHAQDLLIGQNVEPAETAFGRESDMRALGRRFIERGLQASQSSPASWRLSAWACELRRQAERYGARLLIVELPMPFAYVAVRRSALGETLRSRLPADFCGRPVEWLDVSAPPGLTEERFSDGLHLDRNGAALTSRPLGCEAARIAASPGG